MSTGGFPSGFDDDATPDMDSGIGDANIPIMQLDGRLRYPAHPGPQPVGLPMPAGGRKPSIPVWHGSPHDFDKFEFSPRTSRTGEGAQSYAPGLYFAEHPEVAQDYRNKLAKVGNGDRPQDVALRILDAVGGDRQKALAELDRREAAYNQTPPEHRAANFDMGAVRDLITSGQPVGGGRMYRAELRAHPDEFLDWDKPLSAQSKHVQDTLARLGIKRQTADEVYAEARAAGWSERGSRQMAERQAAKANDPLGSDIFHGGQLVPGAHYDSTKAAELLRDAGIKGIRYRDQFSRGEPGDNGAALTRGNIAFWKRSIERGLDVEHAKLKVKENEAALEEILKQPPPPEIKRTHNYVTFDDKHVDILHKYARGGMPTDPVSAAMTIARARGGSVSFIRLAQQLLAKKGFDPGKVDGSAGVKTHAAITAFQKANGIKPTGTVTEETLAALKAPPLPRMRPTGDSPMTRVGNMPNSPDFVSADKDYDPAMMRAGRSNRDNALAEQPVYRPPIGMGSDPNKFGPSLRELGVPPREGSPVNNGIRNLVGLPPNAGNPIRGLAIRTKADLDAREMNPPPPMKVQTGHGEGMGYIRKKLSDWNIIDPANAEERAKGGSTFGPGSLPGARGLRGSSKIKMSPVPGVSGAEPSMPYTAKGHTGGLLSPVAGRTDHIPLDVPNGAYVVPADVVSGLGQGNTIHGTKLLSHLFKGSFRKPHPLAMKRASALRATGGVASGGSGDTIPIMAAGGEYVIGPETVLELGGGDMKRGHDTLDAFVKKARAKTIADMKRLPGPVKS